MKSFSTKKQNASNETHTIKLLTIKCVSSAKIRLNVKLNSELLTHHVEVFKMAVRCFPDSVVGELQF